VRISFAASAREFTRIFLLNAPLESRAGPRPEFGLRGVRLGIWWLRKEFFGQGANFCRVTAFTLSTPAVNLGRYSPPNSPRGLSPLPFRYGTSLWTGLQGGVRGRVPPVRHCECAAMESVEPWRDFNSVLEILSRPVRVEKPHPLGQHYPELSWPVESLSKKFELLRALQTEIRCHTFNYFM
jgi:hypothetical protein